MKPAIGERAFTGLEAAIVLIAFVVVAAVFSYIVLGAGFFTTQKSQAVVHAGVAQDSSTLEIVGNVYVLGTQAVSIDTINFTCALAPGGTPVDFDKVVITYSNATMLETLTHVGVGTPFTAPSAGQWAIAAVYNPVTTDDVLEKGEQFEIMVKPTSPIIKNDKFQLDIKPVIGPALDIIRTSPASIQKVNIVY
ncbi:archaellin/type IV pilin N-terminal domain-containing protein [uncultured Methanoregula sp.]|uniref:archaellin/type IV pilin N-terminal domain-containing protein n=1 Tax=uncultured Methanoregula sp. TaxID=1005933 RepID=UPI002AAC3B80|nr:archaellin/type IV pilin N-terminal domain-containing protein [uncultured Methanoregula sp.]